MASPRQFRRPSPAPIISTSCSKAFPTFVADQQEANYLENYHATTDTFDKVDFPQLKKHVAEAVELSFALANRAEPIGPRLSRAQIEQSMHETHLDQELKDMGMWDEWANGKRGRQQ